MDPEQLEQSQWNRYIRLSLTEPFNSYCPVGNFALFPSCLHVSDFCWENLLSTNSTRTTMLGHSVDWISILKLEIAIGKLLQDFWFQLSNLCAVFVRIGLFPFKLDAVPFFSLCNWETGASEMRDRARDWSEQGRRPRGAAPLARSSLPITVDEKRKELCAVYSPLCPWWILRWQTEGLCLVLGQFAVSQLCFTVWWFCRGGQAWAW